MGTRMTPERIPPGTVMAIAAGGALGAPARYGVARLIHVAPGSFPWATFCTNVSGAFALGLLLMAASGPVRINRRFVPFAATGFLGAYTTFSTFSVETDLLVKDGHLGVALVYVTVTVAAGLGAASLGVVSARRMWPAP